jgi:hypothetical protein
VQKGRTKSYKVHHESPFDGEFKTSLRFILLPYGEYYGDVPENAGHGDKICFINGDKAEIVDIALCDSRSKLIELLALLRYGAEMKFIRRSWEQRATTIGARRGAISDDRCLFVWHGKKI